MFLLPVFVLVCLYYIYSQAQAREAMGPGSPMGTDGRRRRGVVVSGVRRMNEVNARGARLVPGRATVYHLGYTTVSTALDVTGDTALRTLHQRERCLGVRRSTLGNIRQRQTALLRLQQ